MSRDKLTKVEEKKLKEIMSYHENSRYRPYKHISGGFVSSTMVELTYNHIIMEHQHGVQNDVENRVYTEYFFINRHTWDIKSDYKWEH